jgi:dihydroneopterin aldolase
MDTVFIEGLSVAGKHGVMDHERSIEQEFLVDIEAQFDTRASARSDKLPDTLDYGRMRDIAREVIEGEHSYLIERLAERMAQRILEDGRIAQVSVAIRKPAVFPSGVPGIRITRSRDGI